MIMGPHTGHPIRRAFGRRAVQPQAGAAVMPAPSATDDLKLFATTFLGGFLFMAVYLG